MILSLVGKQAPVPSAVGVGRDCLERNVALAMIERDRRDAALRPTLPGGSERTAAQG